MAKARKTIQERIADADAKGSDLLARANELAEAGKAAKAEALYQSAQRWLDISNELRGNA